MNKTEEKQKKRPVNGRLYRKGQSGNPKGRPKAEWTWSGMIKEAMEESYGDNKTIKELMAKSLVKEGLKGNVQAMKEIGDRLEGRPKQSLEMGGIDGKPIESKLIVEYV